MKRLLILSIAVALCLGLFGCGAAPSKAQIAATTLPVYEFTARLCEGTGLEVARLITESVSCLHDYTLQVNQMRAIEDAEVVVCSGAGLEDFLGDSLVYASAVIDASKNIHLLCNESHHEHEHAHDHEQDPHIWLSPINAMAMAGNICDGLCENYPEHEELFHSNLCALKSELETLEAYAHEQLKELSCRQIITFHDGFSYMAADFDIEIVHAIEEESGSEASAAELIQLTNIVAEHRLDALFTERNGSTAAAEIIAAETGAALFQLDMAMADDSYFDAMYHNIDTLKEALE